MAGVGSDAAEAILARYPTPLSLYRAYEASAELARRSNVVPAVLATKVHLQASCVCKRCCRTPLLSLTVCSWPPPAVTQQLGGHCSAR